MADIFVEVELDTSRVDAVFAELIQKSSDLSPLMAQIAQMLDGIKARVFRDEAAPDGIEWPELAESTQRKKVYNGSPRGSAHKLRVMDTFFNSIGPATYGQQFAEIASLLGEPYPSYLQTGTTRMPARPVFGLGNQDIDDVLELAKAYLTKL